MIPVAFHFDCGRPHADLSHLVMPLIEQCTRITCAYVPSLLGGVFQLTNNQSPAERVVGINNTPAYERLELHRCLRRRGMPRFQSTPLFPVHTVMPMRGAIAAQSLGVFARDGGI